MCFILFQSFTIIFIALEFKNRSFLFLLILMRYVKDGISVSGEFSHLVNYYA